MYINVISKNYKAVVMAQLQVSNKDFFILFFLYWLSFYCMVTVN